MILICISSLFYIMIHPIVSKANLFLILVIAVTGTTLSASPLVDEFESGDLAYKTSLVCDRNNPDVSILKPGDDIGIVNSPDKRIFCLTSGDYRNQGRVYISRSGTREKRRYLLYYDAHDMASIDPHPVNRDIKHNAVLSSLEFNGGSWWVVYGLAIIQDGGKEGVLVRFNKGSFSSNNLLDSMLVEGAGGGAGQIYLGKDNYKNTIQNSVARNTIPKSKKDAHCFKIDGASNTALLSNEIYNCAGDGIQLSHLGAPGTLIKDNDIYLTNTMYTDCKGSMLTTGGCACAENAIDVKGATTAEDLAPKDSWVRVLENRMWGFRRTDVDCGGTGDSGNAIVLHWDPSDYILIESNVIRSSDRGINVAEYSRNDHDDGTDHVSIRGNFIYGIHSQGESIGKALVLSKAKEYEVYSNLIFDTDIFLVMGMAPGERNEFNCNLAINAGKPVGAWDAQSDVSFNAYINSESIEGDQEARIQNSLVDKLENSGFCFQDKQLTGPRRTCIPELSLKRIIKLVGFCDEKMLGQSKGIGVDNQLYRPDLKQMLLEIQDSAP